MTPTVDSVLSAHTQQLRSLERDVIDINARAAEDRDDVRGMRNLLIATLGTTVLTLIGVLFTVAKH